MDQIKTRKDRLKNRLLCAAAACMLCMIPASLFAQTGGGIAVRGTVSDNAGPLLGVTVSVQGTTNATTTDADGNYAITVTGENAVLSFSYIGYKTYTERVGSRAVINVVLEEEIARLDEVVVIGYGTQRREAVTGSVASISSEKIMEVASVNVTQALQGRIAGVEMTQTSTKPGATMQIRIRGTRSLTASNDPLVVLDGIPFMGTFNDIDPSSIKSIDILKDASATAIYGSRGANGVILITTNRGVIQQEARITYNGYYGIKDMFSKYPMMDGPQFAKLRADAAATIKAIGSANQPYSNTGDQSDDINIDWQDLFFQKGMVTSHDISVAKGTEKGGYIFGAGFFKEEAVIPTQQYSRISLRTAIDQGVGKYFRFGLTSNNSFGFSEGNQISIGDMLSTPSITNPYNPDGSLKRGVASSSTETYKVWTKETIEEAKDVWLSESKTLGSYNNLYGEVSAPFLEGLKYRINVGLNIRMTTGGGFTGIGATSATDPKAPSSASISNSMSTRWTVEHLLTFDRTFADKHHVNVTGLFSAEQDRSNSSSIGVRDFPGDQFQYYNLGFGEGEKTIDKDAQGYSVSGLISWMGRVMYDYDDRYMLSVAVRSDASSRLAPGYQWHTYPAVSAGWNLHREKFMEGLDWLTALKFRVGYGETSNQAVAPYATLGNLNTRFYNFGDVESGYATGYYISELPNKNLGWEYTETWNFGLDFALFNRRLTGTVEYYKQHTKDILLSVNLPSTTAVGSYMANIGETENKGFELALNGVILNNLNGWTWEAGINLYTNHNKIIALASGDDRNEGARWFVGYPINVIYDYEKIGLWQEGDPYLNILEPGGNVGMIKVKYTGEYDASGKPVRQIGETPGNDDRQIMKVDPNFQGGFNTRVAYKGFDLNIVGAFKSGGILISTLHGRSSYLNNLNGRRNNIDVDYWTPDNTDAKYPRPGGILSSDSPKYGNTLARFDASYMKVRAITLGYNFTQKWMRDTGIERLRLYFTVQNPFVLFSPYHNESGMDPETNSFAYENQAVANDYPNRLPLAVVAFNTPATRNYLFGLSLTF